MYGPWLVVTRKRKGNKSLNREIAHAIFGESQQAKASPMSNDQRMVKPNNHESGSREAKRKASQEGFRMKAQLNSTSGLFAPGTGQGAFKAKDSHHDSKNTVTQSKQLLSQRSQGFSGEASKNASFQFSAVGGSKVGCKSGGNGSGNSEISHRQDQGVSEARDVPKTMVGFSERRSAAEGRTVDGLEDSNARLSESSGGTNRAEGAQPCEQQDHY
nr:hypothetical protein CFP56_05780 [Quercus suber]